MQAVGLVTLPLAPVTWQLATVNANCPIDPRLGRVGAQYEGCRTPHQNPTLRKIQLCASLMP